MTERRHPAENPWGTSAAARKAERLFATAIPPPEVSAETRARHRAFFSKRKSPPHSRTLRIVAAVATLFSASLAFALAIEPTLAPRLIAAVQMLQAATLAPRPVPEHPAEPPHPADDEPTPRPTVEHRPLPDARKGLDPPKPTLPRPFNGPSGPWALVPNVSPLPPEPPAQAPNAPTFELLVRQGELLGLSGDCRGAIELFTAALKASAPGEWGERALYGRAVCHAWLGDAISSHADADAYLSRYRQGLFTDRFQHSHAR